MRITEGQLRRIIRQEVKRPRRPSSDAVWNDAWGRWFEDGEEPINTPEEKASEIAQQIRKSILAVINTAEYSAGPLPHKQYAEIILNVAEEVASEVAKRPDEEY